MQMMKFKLKNLDELASGNKTRISYSKELKYEWDVKINFNKGHAYIYIYI
jgi:hypothetical protein